MMKKIVPFVLILVLVNILFSCNKNSDTETILSDTNSDPIISEINTISIHADIHDSVKISVIDAESDDINVELINNPDFVSVNSLVQNGNTAVATLYLNPKEGDENNYSFSIKAEDSNGGIDEMNIELSVLQSTFLLIDTTIVKSLEVDFLNTDDFEVVSAYIGKSKLDAEYTYGLVKVKYLGNSSLNYVKMDAEFIDVNGDLVFLDDAYLVQEHVASSGNYNTNTYVTPEYNEGYFKILANLESYDSKLADIMKINITIDSRDMNYQSAFGYIDVSTPYQKDKDVWYLDTENTGMENVVLSFASYTLIDSEDRLFKWSYFDHYLWNDESNDYILHDNLSLFPIGQIGYEEGLHNTPDYYGTHYMIINAICLDWDKPKSKGTNAIEKAIHMEYGRKLNKSGLDHDERNFLWKEYRTRICDCRKDTFN